MSDKAKKIIANLEQAYADVEDRKGDYLTQLSAAVDEAVEIIRESRL
jgi:hypothetical protein